MNNTKTTIIVLVLLALVVGLFFQFSGNDSPKELTKFEFPIDWQPEPTYLGVYYAKDLGLFEDLGLDVEIIPSWGANLTAAAVAGGQTKIATSAASAVAIQNSKGANLVSTAVIYPQLPTVLYGLASKNINTPQDLIGKRIGIYAGSITVNELDAFFKLNNIEKDQLEIIPISGADIPLVLSDKVDSVLHYYEMSPVQLGTQEDVYTLRLSDYGVDAYSLNIITTEDTYNNEKKFVEDFTDAIVEGYRKGCKDRDDAIRVYLENIPEKTLDFAQTSWDRVCDELIRGNYGTQTVSRWQTTIDTYGNLGLLGDIPVTPQSVIR